MRTPEDTPTDPDALLRYARIVRVDAATARVTVEIDEGVISPPLRWLAPRMGDTKAWCPPSVGEQVLLLCPAGEIGAGIVLGGVVSNANPAPVASALPLLTFKDGAALSYDPDSHELAFTLPAGASTRLVSDGGIVLTGPVAITGALEVSEDIAAQGDVTAGDVSLQGHRHGQVATGQAQSGPPA